jgi:hypothetical protein
MPVVGPRDERGLGGAEATQAGERRAQAGERDPEIGFGFLRGRIRPATALIVAFIDELVDERQVDADGQSLRWGVESICQQLPEMGCKIAPATYYEHRFRTPTAREVRDAELKPKIEGQADT